jgi:RNA polymerase sigma factor (sigma-70 family)
VRNLDDAPLVEAARAGSRAAFAALVERHWPLLVGCCRRMLGADELVEEAAQESVVQALVGLDRLRNAARFGPWLAGIGLNTCRHLLRERSEAARSPGAVAHRQADDSPGPDELAEAAEIVARVRGAVSALPCGQREAVTLHYLDGLPQREVAAALGIDVGAVKTRLHKARRTLRRRLVEFQEVTEMTPTKSDGVEVRVADVLRHPVEGREPAHVILLEEVGGERRLTLWVGPFEAAFLAVHLENVELQRPGTYTFAARLLEASGATLDAVRINRLTDEVFYAEARVTAAGVTRTVDARPSDALNLALLLGRPITVSTSVFEALGRGPDRPPLVDESRPPEHAADIASDVLARMERSRRLFDEPPPAT